jgi:hypothetical protein
MEAKPYMRAYDDIVERFPPKDRLGCRLVGMVADLWADYERLSQGRRPSTRTASARRKMAGLILGGLRAVADGHNGHAAPDLARLLMDRPEAAP